jgi:hypothetical protein
MRWLLWWRVQRSAQEGNARPTPTAAGVARLLRARLMPRRVPHLLWWHRWGLAMVRVPAVWPDAVHRPSPKLAAFVHLVAERADDGELRKILLPRRVAHVTR